MKTILWLGVMGVVTRGAFAQDPRQTAQRNMEHNNMTQDTMARSDINRPQRPPAMRPFPSRPFNRPIFPLGFGGYGFGGYDYGSIPQATNVVVVQPPPPAYEPAPQRPPETATLVIHEYQPLQATPSQAAEADQPMFAIVLKNSTILSASAIVAQSDGLHIVDPDGAHQRVPLDAIDREATKRVNRERKLQLQLPPER